VAIVGEASIIVRAITTSVRRDIEKAFAGADKIAERAGKGSADSFRRGFGDGGGASLESFTEKAEASRVKLRELSNAGRILVPAIAGVVGIIGSAVTGLVIFTSALGNASRTSIVLGASLMALAQAAITSKLAFQGVGKAISAGLKAQEGGTAGANNQTAALRRLRDARLSLKRLLEQEAPQVLAEARERAAEAADAAADAIRNAERANRTYNESQQESLSAINDLNNARDRAREKIQQLRFELEGGAISEKKARLEFEKARDSLQAVQDLPPNSRARQEAELAFAQAELNLRKAIDSNSDLRKEENAATQAGVEGSKDVVDAKDRIAKASQDESDAAIAASRAMKQAAEAQMAAQKAAQAASAGGAVEKELNQRIADTRQAVKDAEDALKQGAGAVDAYRQALEKLSPEARRFVEFITDDDIQASFRALRASAGRQLFGPLEEAIQNLIDNLFPVLNPLLEKTGGVLGAMAVQFADTVTEGTNLRRLENVWKTNNGLLTNFGLTVSNLYEGFLILLQAAEPLITAFGNWFSRTSDAWVATLRLKEETGELASDFAGAKGTFDTFASIMGNLSDAFGSIGDAINGPGGAGPALLGFLDTVTGKFAADMKTGLEDGTLATFFSDSGENFQKLLEFLGDLGAAIIRFGATPGVGQLLDGLIAAVGYFAEIGPVLGAKDGPVGAFGRFIDAFAKFSALLLEGGGITAFFDTIADAIERLNTFLEKDSVSKFLEAVAPIIGAAAAFGILFRSAKFFFEAFFGYLLLVPNGFKKIKGFFKTFQGGFMKMLGKFGIPMKFAMTGPLLGIVAGVAALIAILVLAYQNSEDFREALKNFGTTVMNALGPAIDGIKEAFATIAPELESAGTFIKDLFKSIGDFLAPIVDFIAEFVAVIITVLGKLIEGVIYIIGSVINVIQGLYNFFMGIVALFSGDTEKAKELFTKAGQFIMEAFKKIFGKTLEALKELFGKIADKIVDFIDYFKTLPGRIAKAGAKMWTWIVDLWNAYWADQQKKLDVFLDFFKKLPGLLAKIGLHMWDWLKDTFKNALNWVIDKWNNFRLSLRIPDNWLTRGAGIAGVGFDIDTPNIPRLAKGGTISPTPGGTLARIAEAGRPERVEPLDPDGLSKRDKAMIALLSGGPGGGTVVNVYPSAGMDERALAEMVSEKMATLIRRGGV